MPIQTGGPRNSDDVRNLLERTFADQGLGQHGVRVTRHSVFKNKLWNDQSGEYQVSITNPNVKDDAWRGVVRAGPNNTLEIRSGTGWQMMTGDLVNVGDKGISPAHPDESEYSVVPYYTGVESFARRIAASFGLKAENLRVGGSDRYGKKVNALFTEINNNTNPAGGNYITADETVIPNNIPGSSTRISQETSPVQRHYVAGQYNIPLVGDPKLALPALSRQVRYNPALQRESVEAAGSPAFSAWGKLTGGDVWKPDKNEANVSGSGGLFITPSAAGSEYYVPVPGDEGSVQGAVAGLTEKFMKQSYTAGRRDVNRFVINTGQRLVELTTPQEAAAQAAAGRTDVVGHEAVQQSGLVMNQGQAGYVGMRTSAVTAIGGLPWQSGQMQVSLPESVRRTVTSMAQGDRTGESGGVLEAGYVGRRKFEIEGVEDINQLINEKWSVDTGMIGQKLTQGRKVQYGQWENPRVKTREIGEDGEVLERNAQTPMSFTTGQQNTSIKDYVMHLPASWGDTEEKRLSMTQQLIELNRRGVSVDFNAGENVVLDVNTLSSTPGGIKGGSAKGSVNVPLVGGAARQITGIQGVSSRRNVGYDILQNAKNIDAVMFNAMQAMPTRGNNNVFDFLSTLYRGDADRTQQISLMQQSVAGDTEPWDLRSLAEGMGFPAGEHLMYDVTNRALQYDIAPDGSATPRPLEQINEALNTELYDRFGVGRMRGRVLVEQYRAEDMPEFRESWMQAQMAGQYDKETRKQTIAPMTREEAEAAWKSQMEPNLELVKLQENQGIYNLYHQGEVLAHPKLMTMVAEASGVGTDQGDILNALKAQRMGSMVEWFASNYSKMFRSTPARGAIQQITGAYLQTEAGGRLEDGGGGLVPAPGSAVTIGEGGIDPQELQTLVSMKMAKIETSNPIDRLNAWEESIREIGGMDAAIPLDRLYLPKQGVVMAGPKHWIAVESDRQAIAEEGGLESVPQAQATTRFMKVLESSVASEASGEMDVMNRELAQSLQSQYINSDQLRKARGSGIFARFGGSPLVAPGRVDLSYQALSRMYQLGGGNMSNQREWRHFVQRAQGTPAMVFRQPGPNIGTAEAPGSYQTMIMQTPNSRSGRMINSAYEQAGLRRPDVILPQSLVSNLGDLDYDPSSVFPMMYRRRTGIGQHQWVAYRPDRYGGDYRNFTNEIMRRASGEVQRNTFDRIFGALGSSFNPLDENMRVAVQESMGNRGSALLDERLALQLQKVQQNVKKWNTVKQIQMGATYNDYIRRPQAALTALGAPSEFLPEVRDTGAYWYQQAIDFTKVYTQWQGLMNTAGFFTGDGNRLQWGWNMADEGEANWAMNYWTPTSKDNSSRNLVNVIGSQIAMIDDARPEWAAGMLMNVPVRPEGIGDTDWRDQLRSRQLELSGRLAPLMETRKGESEISRLNRIRKGISELSSEANPLIGEDSAAIYDTMARSFEYAQKDPTRWSQFSELIDQQGGFRWKNQTMSANEAAQMFKPVSMMYQYSLNKPNADSWMSVMEMSEQFTRARQGGYAGSQIIQEMYKNYGSLVGLRNPMEGPANPLNPVTGETMEITDLKQLTELKAAYAERQQQMVDAYYSGNRGGVRNLSFSSVGGDAAIAESGDLYEDSYHRSLTAGALYGWRNPALRSLNTGLNIRTPQQLVGGRGSDAMFIQKGRATNTGNNVEAAAADIISQNDDFRRMFGAHIGQMPAGKEPRYEVADNDGNRYRIAGIPDFLRLKETAQGAYELDVYDWKNLPSQRGKNRAEVEQYITDNPAYMTQVPGYMKMYSQPERLSDEEFKNFLGALPAEERPLWEKFRKESQEGTLTAPVKTRGAFLTSRFSSDTPTSEYEPKITAGLQAIAEGRETPDVMAIRVPDQEMTLANIAAGDITLAGQAASAIKMGRMTALDAANYQSYVMKEYLNKSPGLRNQFFMGNERMEYTQEELLAKEKWFSGARREGETQYSGMGWEFNPQREGDFAGIFNSLQTQVSTLSGGNVQPQPLAYAPGARAEQARQAAARGGTPIPPPGRQAPAGGAGDGPRPQPVSYGNAAMPMQAIMQAISGMNAANQSTMREFLQGGGGGGRGGRFGGGAFMGPEQATRWMGKMQLMSDEMLGKFVTNPEDGTQTFQKGSFLKTFDELPEHLASFFPEEVKNQIMAERDSKGTISAVQMAQTKALSMGINIKSAFTGGKWSSFREQFKAFDFISKNLQKNLGAVDAEALAGWDGGREIVGSTARQGNDRESVPAISGAMDTMAELTGAIKFQAGAGTKKGDVALSGEQREILVSDTDKFKHTRDQLNSLTESFFRVGPGLDRFAKHFTNLDDAITRADKNSEAWRKAAQHINEIDEGKSKLIDRATEVRSKFGMQGRGRLSDDELSTFAAGAQTVEQRDTLRKYEHELIQQTEREQKVAGQLTGKGPEAPNAGRLFRSMLGGFGMMYIRSVANIAAQPLMFGYDEYNQQESIVRQAGLSGFGETGMSVSPEEYNKRMTASYGGSGWAAIQRMRGTIMEKNPALTGATNLATAGVGGAGLVTTLGMWMGSGTAALGLAPLTASIAMAGAANAQILGASSEVDRNVPAMLGQVMSGRLGYSADRQQLYRPDLVGQPLGNARAVVGEMFNFAQYGMFNQEQKDLMDKLEGLRQYEQGGGKDLRGWLQRNDTPRADINRLMGLYTSAQMSQFPQYSTQALAQASSIRDQYGLGFVQDGSSSGLATMAGWIDGGINIEQLARTMAYSPNQNIDQQRDRAAKIIENLIARQESGGQPLTQREMEKLSLGSERFKSLGAFAPSGLEITPGTPARKVTMAVPSSTAIYVPSYEEMQGGPNSVRPQMSIAEAGRGGFEYKEFTIPAVPGEDERAKYEARLTALNDTQWSFFQRRHQLEQEKAIIGLPYKLPEPEEFAGDMTEKEVIERTRQAEIDEARTSILKQYKQTLRGFGLPADMSKMADMSNLEISYAQQRLNQGYGLGMSLMEGGMETGAATTMGLAIGMMPAQDSYRYQQIMQGNPMEIGRYALANRRRWESMPTHLPGSGGVEIPRDYLAMTDFTETFVRGGSVMNDQMGTRQLEMTGLPWGTTSLATLGTTSYGQATNIWGKGWQGRTDISQGLANALIQGGSWGGQQFQMNQQAQMQAEQAGIQGQQIALNRAFQTGVGLDKYAGSVNPQTGQPFGFNTGSFGFNVMGQSYQSTGGGFWGMEDTQRNLGYAQQEWNFGFQQRQMEMQNTHWQQNSALARRQDVMQRGWTQQDWQYQDQTRGMQWQWHVEDFEEEKRFMTGRDRRLAERQMKRDTTMHNMEENQIDRQRSRQQQLWKLEDTRYELGKKQHNEQLRMQEESLQAQREFYEARKQLELEQNKLQRAYQIEQMKLSEAQIGISLRHAEITRQNAQTMFELSKFSEAASAKGKLFNAETMASLGMSLVELDPAFAAFVKNVEKLNEIFEVEGSGDSGTGGTGDAVVTDPSVWAKEERTQEDINGDGVIGKPSGARSSTSTTTGISLRRSGARPDPWRNETIVGTPTSENNTGTMVSIYIGGEHFKDVIVDTVSKEIYI